MRFGAGWSSILYTADLAAVSKDEIDGASVLQQIWYVELSAIKNVIMTQFILVAGGIEEQWDDYLKKLEDYSLSEYLEIKQKYPDAYFKSLGE